MEAEQLKSFLEHHRPKPRPQQSDKKAPGLQRFVGEVHANLSQVERETTVSKCCSTMHKDSAAISSLSRKTMKNHVFAAFSVAKGMRIQKLPELRTMMAAISRASKALHPNVLIQHSYHTVGPATVNHLP